MKKNKYFFLFFLLVIPALLLFQACSKEDEQPVNENPGITISSPAEGKDFLRGETITILVDATDNDGEIAEVQFFIDEVLKKSMSDPPFSYQWNTMNENAGQHSIEAICVDNEDGEASDKVDVELIEETSNPGSFTDPRDGKTYITVTVKDQTWFAENLNLDTISAAKNQNGQRFETGGYYAWNSAKSACPDGWHLPTDEEWKKLEINMLMLQSEADAIGWRGTVQGMWMKSTEGWQNNGNGTDRYGFNVIPAGYKNEDGELFRYETDAVLWTATAHGSEESAWYRQLNNGSDGIYRSSTNSKARFSVRCIKD